MKKRKVGPEELEQLAQRVVASTTKAASAIDKTIALVEASERRIDQLSKENGKIKIKTVRIDS